MNIVFLKVALLYPSLLRISLCVFLICTGLVGATLSILVASLGTFQTDIQAFLAALLTIAFKGARMLPFVHLGIALLYWPLTRQTIRLPYIVLLLATTGLCFLEVARRVITHQMVLSNFDGQIEPYQAFGPGIIYSLSFIGLSLALVITTLMLLHQLKALKS